MNLFVVIRWGSDQTEGGPNGEDTTYLVNARNHLEAVEIVEEALLHVSHRRVLPKANVVTEIGRSRPGVTEPGIVLGPFLNVAHVMKSYPSWIRHYPNQDWVEARESDYFS